MAYDDKSRPFSPPKFTRRLYRYLSKLTFYPHIFNNLAKLQPHTIWDVILAHYFGVVVYHFLYERGLNPQTIHFRTWLSSVFVSSTCSTFCDDGSSLDIINVSFC
jgi:hypothetical protein